MLNLLWKEWHEQSWKLAFGCIVLGALALIGLHARMIADETMVLTVCFIAIVMLPLLAGTGLIPAERAERSFESLIAMPISPWRILSAKSIVGVLLCVVPMLVAAVVSLSIAGDRELPRMEMAGLFARSTFAALSLFFWMFALTSRLPSEARAGLVAVGILICWGIITLGLNEAAMTAMPGSAPVVPRQILAVSPLTFVFDLENQFKLGPGLWIIVVVQAVTAGVLWVCTIGSFKTSDRVGE